MWAFALIILIIAFLVYSNTREQQWTGRRRRGLNAWAFALIAPIIAFLTHGDTREQQWVIRRRRRLKAWAARRGLAFDMGPEHHIFYEFPQFECLQPGINRYAYNIAKGNWKGRSLWAFDYHFTTGPKNEQFYFSAVIAESHAPLKTLGIRPEKILDKVADSLGFRDIEFESAEFNRMFRVGSPDKRWAHDVLHPRVMEFLVSRPKFIIKLEGTYAIAYRPMVMRVKEFEAAVELLYDILDLLPGYVVRQQKGEATS